MSDEATGGGGGGDASEPARRRGPRRATRPPTGAPPDPLAANDPTVDDTDAGWGERVDDAAHQRWLTEQRPPHWG